MRMSIADSATGMPTAIGPEGESGSIVRPQLREKAYASDLPTLKGTVFGILLAIFGGSAVTLLAWKILKATSLPAFNTSMVTRALSTFALVIFLVALAVLLFFWLRDESHAAKSGSALSRPRWRIWLTYALSYLSPAFLTITTLGIPLSASRLWLDGIQVDQVFRTQFLTRMTETAANQDMAYIDTPTYYPIGWFWLGGRLANLLGMPGWEVYQPWALVSLAAAGCLLVPVWQRLTGSLPVATAIALTTMAICLTLNAEEPYGAVVAMGIPAAAVLARRALLGRWSSSLALALYLGLSATFYTLFTGVAALSVATLIALVLAITRQTWQPILHLVAIGVTSLAIASIAWAPYLLASWRSADPVQSAAQSYLPGEGTETPFPFLAPSIIGVLCFLGVVYIVFRLRDPDVKVMTAALLGVYGWTLASMAFTVAGTTLLGFRTTVIIVMQLATLGVLALADARLVGIHRFYPESFSPEVSARVTALFLILCTAGGIFYAQSIPKENQTAIDHAYSDTDGYGERADRYAPDSTKYYAEIVDRLHEWGHPFEGTVVLTDETHFMGFYPYYGFNAFTNHYANPLSNYNARASRISDWANRSWGDLKDPQKFLDELDAAPWHAPDVMLFRGDLENKDEGFKTHIAEDIYPNQPNNRYVSVLFNPAVFSDELWHVEQFGPFVVVARK